MSENTHESGSKETTGFGSMNIADHFFSAELLPPNEECPIENQFARQFASCILFTFSSAELLEKAMQRERERIVCPDVFLKIHHLPGVLGPVASLFAPGAMKVQPSPTLDALDDPL